MAEPKLNAKLGLDKKEFDKRLKEAEKGVASFGAKLKGLVTAAGLAVLTKELIRFGAEAYKLASKAQSVETAFKRLNSPLLLNNLRKATQGTVSDVELMTNAVRANNFRLPLEQLPKYFEFATRRARETGESVNYLVDSIVLGISRKSPKILDNLGLSLSEINEEFKKTGDYAVAVGNIAERELAKMGNAADDAYVKNMKLSAAWENLKVKIGENSKGIENAVVNLTRIADTIDNKGLSGWKKLSVILLKNWEYLDGILDKQEELRKAATGFNYIAAANTAAGAGMGFNMLGNLPPRQITTLQSLNDELGLLEEQLLGIDINNKKEIASTQKQIKEKQAQIDAILGVNEALKENKRTIQDAEQVWNSMVGSGLQGKAGTLGALEGVLPDPTALATVRGAIVEVGEAAASTAETVGSISMAMSGLVDTLASASEDGAISFAESMNIIGQAAMATISILTALAAAGVFAGEAPKGLIGVFTALAGVATIIATISAVKQTKFADGGLVYGPTNALIGEYPGASSNPEVIAPLDKLKSIMGAGNMSEVKVVGVIRGSDIVLSNARGNNSIYGNT